ncbi:MAG: hypothetical protein H6713_12955 [Myxococcales bacterium]|nr:hypothetical protein [Myxococcales bacterium]
MSFKTCFWSRAAWLLAPALAGCLDENPSFDGDEPAGSTTTATSVATTAGTSGMMTAATSTPNPSGTMGEDSTTTGVASTTAADTTPQQTSDASSSGATQDTDATTTGAPAMVLELPADQAGCFARAPDDVIYAWTVECESITSAGNNNSDVGELVIDGENSDFAGHETRGLLRFPWPAQLDGAQLLALELQLTVTNHTGQAESDSTGTLWSSAPFDLDAQPDAAPALDQLLGEDQGPAALDQLVTWALSPDLLVPGAATHLQLVPVTTDGVHYWNLAAPSVDARPRLLITYSD